jgi:branched-subunit amino acid aminotransferase/4-amino-4-deoxychorismate lyase
VSPDAPRLRWRPETGTFAPVAAIPPAVVDSLLVADGRARAVAAHRSRFAAGCAQLYGVPEAEAARFVTAAIAAIPARGRWFPRFELALVDGRRQWRLWRRPAPPRGTAVRLWLGPPDDRTVPQVKGPDLARLSRLRDDARRAGADEAVLLAADGSVLEGATTSILWWDGDVLCTADPAVPQLPGVTRRLLIEAVTAAGGLVDHRRVRPAELAGAEVWAVNALHGIRPVTGWVGAAIGAGPAHRFPRWQAHLDRLAETLTAQPAAGPRARPTSVGGPHRPAHRRFAAARPTRGDDGNS